ncbi:hypothetical protein SteCoe_3172 [Stentor coeruleus]|uniref:Uncharacterized protein n=1 Tax=Stentor coeruleus TaxID=5963 RepID=A0A1R2CXV3_9CILI|nr:hypothetical protein SteCoe_3172 [Stentor coeruleus]
MESISVTILRKYSSEKTDKITETAYFTPVYKATKERTPQKIPDKKLMGYQKKNTQEKFTQLNKSNYLKKTQVIKDANVKIPSENLRKTQVLRFKEKRNSNNGSYLVPSLKEILSKHSDSYKKITQTLNARNTNFTGSPVIIKYNLHKKTALESKNLTKTLKSLRFNAEIIPESTSKGLSKDDLKAFFNNRSYSKSSANIL